MLFPKFFPDLLEKGEECEEWEPNPQCRLQKIIDELVHRSVSNKQITANKRRLSNHFFFSVRCFPLTVNY